MFAHFQDCQKSLIICWMNETLTWASNQKEKINQKDTEWLYILKLNVSIYIHTYLKMPYGTFILRLNLSFHNKHLTSGICLQCELLQWSFPRNSAAVRGICWLQL